MFEPTSEAVDAWVVYDNLRQPITQSCPTANTLLITGEPASIRKYRSRFTSQFSRLWTSHGGVLHPRVMQRNESQHWHYGIKPSQSHGAPLGFDQLVALERPNKTKLLSVICSSKTVTEDHRRRLDFVNKLRAKFGDQIDVFGSGIRPVADKADAIWNYKFHIVLENDCSDYFMTEKLPDAFLGWSYPIYYGSSEAYHHFPEGSFTAIDIRDPEKSLLIIEDVIRSDAYAHSQSQIAEARKEVLWQHNLIAALARYWRSELTAGDSTVESVKLLPKSHRSSLVIRQLQRLILPSRRKVA